MMRYTNQKLILPPELQCGGSIWNLFANQYLFQKNKRVVTHGQQQYIVTYSMHKTTPANVYTSYVPCNCEHLLTGPSSCHNMDNQQ